jgi:hypothetical protein
MLILALAMEDHAAILRLAQTESDVFSVDAEIRGALKKTFVVSA